MKRQALTNLYEIKRSDSLGKKRILKIAAGFLAVILLFTFLSRAAASVTVPQVTTAMPAKKAIEHRITAEGKVVQNREQAILVEPALLVDEIYVSEGQHVAEGDLLFTLNISSLGDALERTRHEIEKLKLTVKDAENKISLAAQEKREAKDRAQEDYTMAAQTGDQAVQFAAQEVNRAQAKLDDFYIQPGYTGEDSTEISMEGEITQLYEQMADYQAQLDALSQGKVVQEEEAETSGTQKAEIESALKALPGKISQAEASLDAYRRQRAAQEDEARSQQESQLIADLSAKNKAYQDAVNAREQSLTQAQRAIEDAKSPNPSDSTADSISIDISLKQTELAALEDLSSKKGEIKAPVEGVVTRIDLMTGGMTAETAAVTMADLSSGTRYTAQVSKDDEKYISAGQAVTLKASDGKAVEGLMIQSVNINKENADMRDVSVLMPDGDLSVGVSASMTAVQQSDPYPVCVPVSALRVEDNQYFVYVLQEKETVLGLQYTARRQDVTVTDKNGQFAAIEGSLSYSDKVITDSTKPVEAGGTVRLKNA